MLAAMPSAKAILQSLTADGRAHRDRAGKPGGDRASACGSATRSFRRFMDGTTDPLGTLGGDGNSTAYDINSSGVAVGRAPTATVANRAFRFGVFNDVLGFTNRIFDLGTLDPVDTNPGQSEGQSIARAINDFSFIVGRAQTASGVQHAYLTLSGLDQERQAGIYSDIGTLCSNDSACGSEAFDINNRFEVVGFSDTDGGEHHAFLISFLSDGLQDLNDLIPEQDALAFQLERANAINERGVIVGSAIFRSDQEVEFEGGRVIDADAGNIFAFRLTPISPD